MDRTNEIRTLLDANQSFRRYLFIRGYIISDADLGDISSFPFYDMYSEKKISGYTFRIHKDQHFYTCDLGDATLFMIGSCVNPFTHVYDENKILSKLSKFYPIKSRMINYINELTGDFLLGIVKGVKLYFISDPAGMLFGCYGKFNGHIYISSHPQLVDDICSLEKSDYIQRLENYRFFYKYGLFFPGDLTQYQGLNRLLQNHITVYNGEKFTVERFYPIEAIHETQSDKEYNSLIKKCTAILHDTMECIAEKYKKPAISLTGGMDSKTTLACANGLYEKFRYYSYDSMAGDRIDIEAAHSIAEHIGLPHTVYKISEQDDSFENFNEIQAILIHNMGCYKSNSNDVRKRLFFAAQNDFDVEVKSWVSEIARANYYKKFRTAKMPKVLSPRNMTSMYKIFITERKLAKETDEIFEDFINKTKFDFLPDGFDASDMYLWEFRYSAWGGLVITAEHSFSYELFIPYNNRNLLNLMLQAPKQKRISDEFHHDMIISANPMVDELGITITNWNETKKRAIIEKAYYKINSILKYI